MTEPIRSFDWWMLAIEVGVLLLVAYEVGVTIIHQIKEAKRRKVLRKIEAEVRKLVAAGEELKKSIPYDNAHGVEWPETVDGWVENVEAYLTPLSSKALSEFDSYAHPNPRYRDYWAQGRILHASGYIGDTLERLNMKLENLRRIAHRCEDYF